jgi:hypothetical protein
MCIQQSGSSACPTLRKSYASPWNPWTLVEAVDNQMGRRFNWSALPSNTPAWYPSSWSTSAMGLLSLKNVVLGILIGYPATEVDLLIPSGPRFESWWAHQRNSLTVNHLQRRAELVHRDQRISHPLVDPQPTFRIPGPVHALQSVTPERAMIGTTLGHFETEKDADWMRFQCSGIGVSFNQAEERVHAVQQVGRPQDT